MKLKLFTLGVSIFALSVSAESEQSQPAASTNLGPDVQILQSKSADIEEFRSNGQVYMIKVKPKKGPAYYLVDADGDGDFDTRRNDLQPNLLIPSWVLFSW